LSASANALITRYLEEAITAGRSFEAQLRGFASDGDDEEVQATFATHADETHQQFERLTERLLTFGEKPSDGRSDLAQAVEAAPKLVGSGVAEEHIAQNLITAYTIAMAECAMYEALATAASAAGDPETEQLARQIQEQEIKAAGKLWKFIPSRAKIAFNMLTVQEVDPSVETRAADNRLVE
jgi:ferritin-like metal-binding protein YciE